MALSFSQDFVAIAISAVLTAIVILGRRKLSKSLSRDANGGGDGRNTISCIALAALSIAGPAMAGPKCSAADWLIPDRSPPWTVCGDECPAHCPGEPKDGDPAKGYNPINGGWDGCNGREMVHGHLTWVHYHRWVRPPKGVLNNCHW
jgi:hypothetical protein